MRYTMVMSPSRLLAPGALLTALCYGNPALAQDFVEPFDSAGAGLFVGYAFGSGADTVTWGLEAFVSKQIGYDACADQERTVYGPIGRISLHGLSRPALTLAAHGGHEFDRATFGLSAEVGLTLGFPRGMEADAALSPHTGLAVESILFDVFARQEWLLDVYSVGAGVRVLPTFGDLSTCEVVVGRPQRDAEGCRVANRRSILPRGEMSRKQALAHDFRAQAEEEFESVPAFVRLASELEGVGAPASLRCRALRAAIDELGHANLCASVANAYGPAYAPPHPRAVHRERLSGRVGLERLATESFLDGCVGEGLAATLAQDDARHATEPLIQVVQSAIARDEQRHERLAWDIVRWCLEREPRVKRALRAVSSAAVEPPRTLTGHVERHRAIAHRHRSWSVERLGALF